MMKVQKQMTDLVDSTARDKEKAKLAAAQAAALKAGEKDRKPPAKVVSEQDFIQPSMLGYSMRRR